MRRGKASPKTSKLERSITQRVVPHPTQLVSTVTFNRTVRYQVTASAAVLQGISRANLLNTFVVNNAGGMANCRLCDAVKLNRIDIWSPGTSAYVPSTCAVQWVSEYGPNKEVTDTSITTDAAYLSTKPPKGSLAGFTSASGSNEATVLFFISADINAIIDVNITATIFRGVGVNIVSTNAGIANTIYTQGLDWPGAGNIPPVAYPTLF